MKYPLFILIDLAISTVFGDPHKLVAVSNGCIADALYHQLRDNDPNVEEPTSSTDLDPDTKNRICHHITSSAFFRGDLEEKPVYMHQQYEKLVYDDPDLFLELYENAGCDLIYTNRTRRYDVHVNREDKQTFQDHAFVCLSVDIDDEEDFRARLVSREYNISDKSDSYIAGRFILDYHDKNIVEVFAVAVEPAKSLSKPGGDVEHVYLERRAENVPVENEFDDPICGLDEEERKHACTSVLTSAYFEGELKFVPLDRYVDVRQCVKRQISFQDDQVRAKTRGNVYEEWMIRCIPEQRYASFQSEYFLSRVYNSTNELFVYRWSKLSNIVIENLFGNVRYKVNYSRNDLRHCAPDQPK